MLAHNEKKKARENNITEERQVFRLPVQWDDTDKA